jgi:hypothetical protein
MSRSGSTGRFRRTHGQSPRVLAVGAAESAPRARASFAAVDGLLAWEDEPGALTELGAAATH